MVDQKKVQEAIKLLLEGIGKIPIGRTEGDTGADRQDV